MSHKILVFVLLATTLLLSGRCADKKGNKKRVVTSEALMEMNKRMVTGDKDRIKAYVEKHQLLMKPSPTGMYYHISSDVDGEPIREKSIVTYNYEIRLLDSTLCYTSDDTGPKTITIGRGGAEVGITEGLRMLSKGDKAELILPPHLAHGLVGDDDKIPPRSILLVDIHVVDVKN
jgi:FKBP-type peptidyl-prolyl cis-trans isomerase